MLGKSTQQLFRKIQQHLCTFCHIERCQQSKRVFHSTLRTKSVAEVAFSGQLKIPTACQTRIAGQVGECVAKVGKVELNSNSQTLSLQLSLSVGNSGGLLAQVRRVPLAAIGLGCRACTAEASRGRSGACVRGFGGISKNLLWLCQT